jgi:hypothetical protein
MLGGSVKVERVNRVSELIVMIRFWLKSEEHGLEILQQCATPYGLKLQLIQPGIRGVGARYTVTLLGALPVVIRI